MPHSPPRIPPAPPEAFTEEQRTLVGDWTALNFSRVIVEHPALYRALIPLIGKLVAGSDLPPRDREILVLRTLALGEETYETAHHVLIARQAGLTDAEIEAAQRGQGEALTPFDQTLVRAAEELLREHRVGDETWRALAERYGKTELMELVALVGLYAAMAMLTKSFGIELEDAETFDRLRRLRDYT